MDDLSQSDGPADASKRGQMDPIIAAMMESLTDVIGDDAVRRFIDSEFDDGFDVSAIQPSPIGIFALTIRVMLHATSLGYSDDAINRLKLCLSPSYVYKVASDRSNRTLH